MKKLFFLSLALFALHLGARAQDTSIVFGTAFHISGGVSRGGTGIVYQWQCNGNDIDEATNPDYTTLTTLKPGMYTYVRKSVCVECGGRWQYTNPHTIEVICPDSSSLRPVRFTDSATTVCVGTVFTYAVPSVANTTYQWKFPNGWAQTSGTNTNSVKVRADSATGSVSVTAIHTPSGCASTARSVTVGTVNKPPTLTLTSTNNFNQRVFQGVAITGITYTRGGTTNGNAEISGNPTGVTVGTSGSTITVSGTPSVSSASAYTYTVTAKAATSCPTAATATGTIVSIACASPGRVLNNKCYNAKGDVVFTGSTSTCQSWFGTEYVLAPYTDAQYFSCPFNGVYTIFTGYKGNNTSGFFFARSNCTSASGSANDRVLGVGIGRSASIIGHIADINADDKHYSDMGHLCYRLP